MVKPTVAGVYSATYSNIPVYEYQFGDALKEHVMRRRHDDWINATHILKAAGFDKPARTRILEREVQKENHEKVQGGYGKYQGTWVSLEQGQALAQRNNVYEKLRPIFEFTPGNISPPPAPKHTTNKPKVPKKPAVPKWGSSEPKRVRKKGIIANNVEPVAPPARVVEDEYDNQSAQYNDDESMADDVTVASASFIAEDDRYDASQNTGHRKRKREEDAQHARDQAHLSYTDELLDYFMTSGHANPVPRPEPPLNFHADWTIDQEQHTALHWAAAMGDIDVIKQLKTFGANLSAKNIRGETPLMRAVLFTNCKDKQSMPMVIKELVNTIIECDQCGSTVLHHAAASTAQLTKQRPARYYIDLICNKMGEMFEPEHNQEILDAQDIEGNTAIHIAAMNGARKIVRALIGRGARTDIFNKDGITAENLIQEINNKSRREYHQGSSSPFAPRDEPHLEDADRSWPEDYETPPRQIRRSKAPAHYSEAAMSVEKKIYPLLQEKFGELADSFDDELKDKESAEQEAQRIVGNVQQELQEIRKRISDVSKTADDPDTKAKIQAEVSEKEQRILSLVEQGQQLQLLNRVHHEENKTNGHVPKAEEDDLAEKAMLWKILSQEQEKRRGLVGKYVDALGAAGDIGEMGELYRRVIAESMDRANPDELDDEIDVLLETMQEEERCSQAAVLSPDEE